MSIYIDTTKLTNEKLKNIFSNTFRYSWYKNTPGEFYSFNDPVIPSLPVISNTSEETDNFVATIYWAHDVIYNTRDWDTARGSVSSIRYGAKITPPNNNTHVCLVRYKSAPINKWNDTYTTDGWLILSNTYGTESVLIEGKTPSLLNYHSLDHHYDIVNDYRNSEYKNTTISPDGHLTFGVNDTIRPHNRNDFISASSIRGMNTEESNNLINIFDDFGGLYLGLDSGVDSVTETHPIVDILPSQSINWFYGRQIVQINKIPDWIPVYDISQVDDIVKFLKTGDDSGSIDIFDNTPEKTVIDDLTNTSYRIFVSPDTDDKKRTHFSIIAYNPEYIEYGERVAGEYGMHVSLDYIKTQTSSVESFNIGNFAQSKYPTLGYIMSDVGYSSVFNLSFRNLNDNTQPIRVYSVGFEADKTKESQCQLAGANYGGQRLTKTHIVDGYRFEHENTWIEVLFRAVDISDLNGGYPDPDDTDDDKSGTDSDYSGASGLRTFVINNTDFDTINSKLWSTDWSTVFKSNSIDPIRCVIACKGIPFTADNVSSAEVMIANLDTGLSKNYVKTVKSFTANSVLMPSFSGDFTDITLTHIRCYLPYIGWVELPASECISRVAYTSVGIEARPKRLKFKYLVDFVDGNVRCIVSVNDTERWFFDGNCAIDIPVTSDNHTQAISNAIRSGVQTGLSIVTAIGGAVAKNAGAVAGGVMGAMQSAPNIFPTYSFTATSNGSGYINASMNQHIMLVIEHPNVIRSADYAKRVGVPCGLSLNLGSLHGYTRCVDVNVTGIDATPNEIQRIKSLLESGVYL